MPQSQSLFRTFGPLSRLFSSSKFSYQSIRRTGSTRFYGADASPTAQSQQSWFLRMWDSPVGVKTVHFWAPVMKWALVLAGITDFARPAEKLSAAQNASLTATGLIWTRWCLIIKPKNYLLAAVNFFLGMVGIVQCTRVAIYRATHKQKEALPQPVKAAEDSKTA